MALDFPSDPEIDEVHDRWQWNGVAWELYAVDGFGGSFQARTIDTDELFRLIVFSDGTVRAIPVTAEAPSAPLTFTITPRITSVSMTWSAGAGASTYRIYRDGVFIGQTSATSFRDGDVDVGETYNYNVQSVSNYLLRSGLSVTRTAYIDVALNNDPVIEIRVYPPTVAVGNRAIVRVNARDVDGQELAMALETDVGTLTPTDDPSVWYLDPV